LDVCWFDGFGGWRFESFGIWRFCGGGCVCWWWWWWTRLFDIVGEGIIVVVVDLGLVDIVSPYV
jgi:hypothetical protein